MCLLLCHNEGGWNSTFSTGWQLFPFPHYSTNKSFILARCIISKSRLDKVIKPNLNVLCSQLQKSLPN